MTAEHIPTDTTRAVVRTHSAVGTPQATISRLIGVSEPTLRKHYADEIAVAADEANAAVAGKLYNKAIAGNVACMIFWMKTRGGWREVNRTELTGPNGAPIQSEVVTAEGLIERAKRLGLDPKALGLEGPENDGS